MSGGSVSFICTAEKLATGHQFITEAEKQNWQEGVLYIQFHSSNGKEIEL
jgi:hypothetical protein